jgi:hypothetical protein
MDMLNALMKSTLVKGIEAQLEPAIVAVVQRCIEIYIRHRGVPLNFSAALAQAGFRSDPDVCEKLYSVVLLSICMSDLTPAEVPAAVNGARSE